MQQRKVRARTYQASLEALESRQLLSGVEPTAVEQLYLEQLNDARANPPAYGQSIGLDLSNVAAAQPLAFDTRLIDAARQHSQDMAARHYFDHNTPEGITPFQRIQAAGFLFSAAAEAISSGESTTDQSLSDFIIDKGVPDLGHRVNLLALDSTTQSLRQTGIGISPTTSGQPGPGAYYTIDSAISGDMRPFLLGVVIRDDNNNHKYDIGEGLGGVTITVSGGGTTQTFGSGGYSIQLNPGTYNVTASGGSLSSPVTQTVTLSTANVRLNFFAPTSPPPPVGQIHLTRNSHIFVTGADAGGGPNVVVFDANTDRPLLSFFPYSVGFAGGVRVAVGDVSGDGTPDIITVPGPGLSPEVHIYDGSTGNLMRQFFAYDPAFIGGQYLAVGDVNADGFDDIIIGADHGGGPNVVVFSGLDGKQLYNFFAYDPRFIGGVRVATGDVNGDGNADIICGSGPAGGPNVTVYSGVDGSRIRNFFAYDFHFTLGIYVAAGDVNHDGKADIVTGAGAGGGPNVAVFNGADSTLLQTFFPYDPRFVGGVRVATASQSDGNVRVLSVAGPGGGADVRRYDGVSAQLLDQFFAYDPRFSGGLYVAGGH